MKNFQDNSFTNAFQRLLAKAKPTPTSTTWKFAGTTWRRDRHSFTGQDYTMTTDIYRLSSEGQGAWALMLVFETWWHASSEKPVRHGHWSKLLKGRKLDALTWFRAQEKVL